MKKLLTLLLLLLFFSANAQKNKTYYKRFSGKISVVSEDVIKYDEEILIIYDTDAKLKPVFESGILFPNILKGFAGIKIAKPQKTDSVNNVNHNFTIQKFQMLRPKTRKVRQFKFLLYQNDIANPTEYFVELWNPKATWKTDIKKFIKGSKLKSIKRGSLVL
jgi:hypothetical protein